MCHRTPSLVTSSAPRIVWSVSLPWYGGAFCRFWALFRPTFEIFAISPWAPEVSLPFDQWDGGILCPFCPYFNSPDSCILGGWPPVWNGLPLALRLLSRVHSDTSYSSLKTALVASRERFWVVTLVIFSKSVHFSRQKSQELMKSHKITTLWLLPYRPSPGKILKNSEITIHHLLT